MAKKLKQLLPFRKRTKLRDSDRKFLESLDFDLFTTHGRGRQSNYAVIYEYSGDGDGRSVSSFSTNATMDNNIGPGRMLDKLYQYLGRRLEWGILRISMSSLHPNKILHGLLSLYEIVVELDSDSDSDDGEYLKPESREVGKPVQMTEVIAELHEHHGSAATIAGLQSLVHQTQSKSLYRSAAALAALVHLAISESSDILLKFLYAVSRLEPIFQLEAKAMALDDSHPDKWLFLSVVSMARLSPDNMGKYFGNPGFKTVYCLRQDLIKLMQEDQVDRHGSLYSLTKSLSLLFDCLITAYATEDDQRLAIACLAQTTYFLILFFLKHLDKLLYYSDGMQQIGNFIMNYCLMGFESQIRDLLRRLSVEQHHIFSPVKVFQERNPRAPVLLERLCARLDRCPYNDNSLDPCYLPRNYQGKEWSPYTIVNRICMRNSRQLLSSSVDELKQEFLKNKYRDLHFKMFLRDGLLNLLQDEWSLENLRQTHERARKVEIIDNDVTHEFIAARDRPHWDAWEEEEDYTLWKRYKKYCNRRRVWGECVRSDMDWDWDSGSCLTNLFTIKDPSESTVRGANTASQLYGYGSQGETAQMVLEDARATLPKQIRVRYEDGKGRIRYKTYLTSPSTESIASGLSAPLTYPTVDSNHTEEAEGDEEGDDADGSSIYGSALEFPLD